MTAPTNCPACGANNPAGAPWCNQCFSALGEPASPPQARPAPATPSDGGAGSRPEVPVEAGGDHQPVGAQQVEAATGSGDGEGATWTCSRCETENPLTADHCSLCQTPIFVSFGAEESTAPSLSPREAVQQALVPGLAHIRLGEGITGFTIGLLVWVLIGFALIIAFGGGGAGSVLLIFFSALAIIAVSAHDAQRLAQRNPGAVLLKPRTLTFVAMAAIGLVVAIIWVQGISNAS